MITAAQLWYVCHVYPESVTHEECEKEFNEYVKRHDSYQEEYVNPHWQMKDSIGFLWEARASVINKLIKEANHA